MRCSSFVVAWLVLGSFTLIRAPAVAADAAPLNSNGAQPCGSRARQADQPCIVEKQPSIQELERRLDGRNSAWWVSGNEMTAAARLRAGETAELCCGISGRLNAILRTDLAAITVHVPAIEKSILEIAVFKSGELRPPEVFRGPDAPPAPAMNFPLKGKIISMDFPSRSLAQRRKVTIYLPPEHGTAKKLPAAYLADGESVIGYAAISEAQVLRRKSSPVILVGVHSAGGEIEGCEYSTCDRRNLEYVHLGSSHFKKHLSFVADEVIPFVEAKYSASRERRDRIAAGYSSGAVWAFSAAALRPGTFGKVLAMSPGGRQTAALASRLTDSRIYVGAGLFEPRFLQSARTRAKLARAAGSDVRFRQITASHISAMWHVLFAEGLMWLEPVTVPVTVTVH